MHRSIFKNSLYKGTLNFFNLVLPLLVTPYVYRILSPETIGQVEYSTSIFGYFSLFGVLGIYTYGVREVSKNRDSQKEVRYIYANLFFIGCISNLIMLCIYSLFIQIWFYSSPIYLLLLVTGFNFISNIFYTEWVNEAFEDFKFIAIKTVLIRIFYAIAVFCFIKSPDDVWIYLLLIIISNFLNYIVSFIYSIRYTDFSLFDFRCRDLNLAFYLPPLLFILLLNNSSIFYTLLDKLMLGSYCGTDAVAYYSVGQKIMEMSRSLLLTLTLVTLPRLSYYLNSQYDLYLLNLNKLIRIVLMLAIPMSVGLILLGHSIVFVFAGAQYADAVWPLYIFGLRFVTLMVENITAQQTMFLHGKERMIALYNAFWGICNLVLNYTLIVIGVFTPTTAIISTLFVELGLLATELWYIKSKLNIRISLFNKGNVTYLLISVCFIPMIFVLKSFIINSYVFFLTSISICISFYIMTLYILRNRTFIEVLNHFHLNTKFRL